MLLGVFLGQQRLACRHLNLSVAANDASLGRIRKLPVEVLELHGAYFAGLILILAALLDGLFVESRSCCKHVVRD